MTTKPTGSYWLKLNSSIAQMVQQKATATKIMGFQGMHGLIKYILAVTLSKSVCQMHTYIVKQMK